MTLTALEQQLLKFNALIEKWESAGLMGCNVMHECRTMLNTATAFNTQVKRAATLLKEGKVEEAATALGDYTIACNTVA